MITNVSISNDNLRDYLFLGVCLPLRMLMILLFIFYRNYLDILYVIFFSIFFFYSTSVVIQGKKRALCGQIRWWPSYMHAASYFLFVFFTIAGFEISYIFLVFDILFSVVSYYCFKHETIDNDLKEDIEFGEGDLSEAELEEKKMQELESKKNPFSIIMGMSNKITKKEWKQFDDLEVI